MGWRNISGEKMWWEIFRTKFLKWKSTLTPWISCHFAAKCYCSANTRRQTHVYSYRLGRRLLGFSSRCLLNCPTTIPRVVEFFVVVYHSDISFSTHRPAKLTKRVDTLLFILGGFSECFPVRLPRGRFLISIFWVDLLDLCCDSRLLSVTPTRTVTIFILMTLVGYARCGTYVSQTKTCLRDFTDKVRQIIGGRKIIGVQMHPFPCSVP